MTRQYLRNRAPKFQGADESAPYPKPQRSLRLSTVLIVLAVLLLLAALYETAPSRNLPGCTGDSGPRYCVD